MLLSPGKQKGKTGTDKLGGMGDGKRILDWLPILLTVFLMTLIPRDSTFSQRPCLVKQKSLVWISSSPTLGALDAIGESR